MILQAHRGVCTEYPENTMSAFKGAVCQGYQVIELDPGVTADGVFVILHDLFINRTARRQDGSVIEERRKLTEMTYEEASQYDYGVWFAPKFKGEKLPLLKDVLQWAKEKNVLLKIDNKIWNFPEKSMKSFWAMLRDSGAKLGMTCNSTDRVRIAVKELPNAEIHYDGEVTREILQILGRITDRLVVWLPYESQSTSWVKVPFATKPLCSMVKEYAKLGIWIVDNYEDFGEINRCFAPDIVETPGQIKPMQNPDRIVDMHTHSEHSHDSSCSIADMWKAQKGEGAYAFAVTDHCDILYCEQQDVTACIRNSVAEVERLREAGHDVDERSEAGTRFSREGYEREAPCILSGIEVGEGIWYPEVTDQALKMSDYDVVIASVHTIRYKQYNMPYSHIDFFRMDTEEIYGYLDQYLDDVLKTLQTIPCDIAAHLMCPLRYINGKYGCSIDGRRFEGKIRNILEFIIRHGIALEVNTSGVENERMPICADSGVENRKIDWLEQDWILEMYAQMGGQLITIGSDAHVSQAAARAFDWAVELLRKHGFRNYFYYEKRRSIQCTIK